MPDSLANISSGKLDCVFSSASYVYQGSCARGRPFGSCSERVA